MLHLYAWHSENVPFDQNCNKIFKSMKLLKSHGVEQVRKKYSILLKQQCSFKLCAQLNKIKYFPLHWLKRLLFWVHGAYSESGYLSRDITKLLILNRFIITWFILRKCEWEKKNNQSYEETLCFFSVYSPYFLSMHCECECFKISMKYESTSIQESTWSLLALTPIYIHIPIESIRLFCVFLCAQSNLLLKLFTKAKFVFHYVYISL